MNLATVISRELRVQSRRRAVYLQRILFTGVALAACCWAYFDESGSGQGIAMLVWTTASTMILFGFGAALAVSDSISGERRENTLGLLLLTPLKSRDVLLGKVISSGSHFLLCLLAVFPVLALPILSGGVNWEEVARQCLNVLVVVGFGMAVGVFWSVIFKEAKSSAVVGLFSLLLLSTLPICLIVLSLISREGTGRNEGPSLFEILIAGPVFMVPLALSSVLQAESVLAYAVSVGGVVLMTLVFMGAALYAFRIVWKREMDPRPVKLERAPSIKKKGKLGIKREWIVPTMQRTSALEFPDHTGAYEQLGRAYTGDQPYIRTIIPLLVAACLMFTWGAATLDEPYLKSPFSGFAVVSLVLLECFVRFAIAIEAPRQVFSDKSSGMLELILTTPVRHIEVVSGLLKPFGGAHGGKTMALCACHLINWMAILGSTSIPIWGVRSGDLGAHALIHLGLAISVPFEMKALHRVGVALGLRCKSQLLASVQAFVEGCVLPLLVLFLMVALFESHVMTILIWHLLRFLWWQRLLRRSQSTLTRLRLEVAGG